MMFHKKFQQSQTELWHLAQGAFLTLHTIWFKCQQRHADIFSQFNFTVHCNLEKQGINADGQPQRCSFCVSGSSSALVCGNKDPLTKTSTSLKQFDNSV